MKKLLAVLLCMMLIVAGCDGYTMQEMDEKLQDNDILYMKLTGVQNVADKPFALRFEMKNKMEKAQRVTLEGTTINDYHIDPDWEITLKPGEEKTVIVEWPIEKFDYNGVDVGGVKIIDLQMLSYEAEKPDSIIWGYTDLVTIDDSKPYTYTDLEGCPMVLENPDLEIAVLGFEKRADGLAVKVHSENVGESLLDVKMTEAKIDGIPCDGTFAFTVSRGSTYIKDLFFPSEALEAAGIKDFKKLEWTIAVEDKYDKIEPFTATLACDITLPAEPAK